MSTSTLLRRLPYLRSYFGYYTCSNLNFTIGTIVCRASWNENLKKRFEENVKRRLPPPPDTRSNDEQEKQLVFQKKLNYGLQALLIFVILYMVHGYFFSYYYDLDHEEKMLAGVPGYMGYMLKVDPLYEERIEKLRKKRDKYGNTFRRD